jgi:hypothetical protein
MFAVIPLREISMRNARGFIGVDMPVVYVRKRNGERAAWRRNPDIAPLALIAALLEAQIEGRYPELEWWR